MSRITNLIIRLQRWMDSVPGQTLMNYAYSWGASIVILGALFKLTHLPGGNLMLFIGMGTEVIVFFISAFDRPFDKQEIGKVLPRTLEEARQLSENEVAAVADLEAGAEAVAVAPAGVQAGVQPVQVVPGGVQIVQPAVQVVQPAAAGGSNVAGEQPAAVVAPAQETVQPVSPIADTPELADATAAYVEKLRSLTDALQKVEEQSHRLGRDSEEMGELNRTITAITKAYDMQLRGVSSQIGTLDEINNQINQLAQQLASLNAIYSRMIAALSVQAPAAAAPTAPAL